MNKCIDSLSDLLYELKNEPFICDVELENISIHTKEIAKIIKEIQLVIDNKII